MPIVSVDHFDQLVIQHYAQREEKVVSPILRWLKESGTEKALEGFVNKALTTFARHGVDNAIKTRRRSVSFSLSIPKMAQQFWQQMTPQNQKQVNPDVLTLATKILLEGAGYRIDVDVLKYEIELIDVKDEPVTPEERSENGSDNVLPPSPVLESSPEDSFPEVGTDVT